MGRALAASADLPADVETASAVLSSPSWPPVLATRLHDDSRVVRAEARPDGGALLVTSRRLPDGTPGWLQRFLPQDGRITQTDRWGPARHGVRHGTWQASFPGSPGEVAGEMRVEPVGDGCRWRVTGQVTLKIPIVGGKAEGFLAPLVERLVAAQAEALRGQLAAR